MTVVPDASVVVAALTDTGLAGARAEPVLLEGQLAAPHLLPVEVASVLRRGSLGGVLPPDRVALAHAELLRLPTEPFPYLPLADRAWQLRQTVTTYDAWYVALAESLADLATLDLRLAGASGPRCRFRTPENA